jgi:cell division protein FtsB
MREFQERLSEKNKIKKRMYSKTTLLLMFIFIIILLQGVYKVYLKDQASQNELERIRNEYTDISKRYEEIKMKDSQLSDKDGIEVELRGKYDISKPNEKVIVVVEPESVPAPVDDVGVMRRMWKKVTGVFR